MTADAQAPNTPDTATAVPERSEEQRQAGRMEGWSIAWMLLALVIWGWFGFLMLADYGPESGQRLMCRGPLVGPLSEDRACRDALREWPALLGILALAVLATVVAAATTVYAKVLTRLSGREWPGARPQD
ncbi:hypothetical protein [Streptomyces sp. NRRL F-4428]|uniref:hypothetical protein n=1 Tax=Streptomyces sp. NRRL F-4428 TaxID=1609137 RepID=UPI0005EC3DC8|nr:hypothetical protein [Streptomyces sp. NRRL F-4428]KJK52412.1 hypothetical protein UK14_09275 [Streptomyces sp. NRRL F-4428]